MSLLGICLVGSPLTSYLKAQNIVTIFGQEKIEKTDEGEVFHTFHDGFLLPGGTNPGTLFNGQDMIGWLYATDNFTRPSDGLRIPYSYKNMDSQVEDAYLKWLAKSKGEKDMKQLPQWTWTSIKADDTGLFKRPEMRSAFLYTEYDSPKEEIALLETAGGTRTYINGVLHEGDHYDFGYTLNPIKLKKGINQFVYTPGRFGKVASKLVKPDKPVMFTKRDMTLPDIIIGENTPKWAAIRVVNASEKPLKDLRIRTTLPNGQQEITKTQNIMPMAVRKLNYLVPAFANASVGNVTAKVELIDKAGKVIDATDVEFRTIEPTTHHERTFVSNIDGSVQYYSVAPAIRENKGDKKAMVLSVHGAGVEARNQARAYKSKDWTDIIAATNRRPYGFNWEEWGRMDALEVLEEAKRVFQPYDSLIYLTGHSMGGHGSWFLGTTYPDKFAGVAPCAGYPDIAGYSRGRGDDMHSNNHSYEAFARSANGGRVKNMAKNLKQSGVYIFHGDADSVVSPEQAREMRQLLGQFHPDFCYYEYPGGEHWFGDESVDWAPIFDFFKRHHIPTNSEVVELDFNTASPAISNKDYWITVEQQDIPYDFSNVKAKVKGDTIFIDSITNVALMGIDIPSLKLDKLVATVVIGDQTFTKTTSKPLLLQKTNNAWDAINQINPKEKYSKRYGNFKNAFDNNFVLVYGTKGNAQETEWNQDKARFDAETFYYRANGSVEVISDLDYIPSRYKDRNVIVYGNKDTNRLWNTLLKDSPIQISRKEIKAGNKNYVGEDLGAYFVYPNPTSDTTSVGVVAGTGSAGIRSVAPNNYISGITGFPDYMIFRANILKDGLDAVETAGFFTNDWKLK